jgi:hypothetical protein
MMLEKPIKGILILEESKHDPVFEPVGWPMKIEFNRYPSLGESFDFINDRYGLCHTSAVSRLDGTDADLLIFTRNSTYRLRVPE